MTTKKTLPNTTTLNPILLACLVVALLEGFAGLGVEIYAIRVSAIYIGASTSITGVILAMVLLAIAIGYWYGGILSNKTTSSIDALLKAGRCLAWAAAFHTAACLIQLPLLSLITQYISNPILVAGCVGLLFGVGLALGSTAIPLITQFLTLRTQQNNQNSTEAGKNAGAMVAITTVGSVLGSTVTPMLLLPHIGLMGSLALFVVSLAVSASVCTLIARHIQNKNADVSDHHPTLGNHLIAALAVLVTIAFITVSKIDGGYQTATTAWFVDEVTIKGNAGVVISDFPKHAISSCWLYETQANCTWYGEATIEAINHTKAKKLIFLGGAGMAIPSEMAYRNKSLDITVVDIDKDLPAIVEQHFLKAPIPSNIKFVGDGGRGYINRNKNTKYEFMFIDVFNGGYVASNLYTVEALAAFKAASPNIIANVIGRTGVDHPYTKTILKNWFDVFGKAAHVITEEDSDNTQLQNILLCSFACKGGTPLYKATYLDRGFETHTDDMPRLDKYYYRSI